MELDTNFNTKFNNRVKRLAKQGCILSDTEIQDALEKLLAGECEICHNNYVASDLCIDHDHTTKKYRGILCKRCNYLGGFVDRLVSGKGNIELLPEFYNYLKRGKR
jgi:hypothetical protein